MLELRWSSRQDVTTQFLQLFDNSRLAICISFGMTNPVLLAIALTCAMLVPRSAPAATNISSTSGQPAIGPKPGKPWENSLGMKFVPVPGANVLFCIWETRVQDYEAFVKATGHNAGKGWRDPKPPPKITPPGFRRRRCIRW
jgi:hypothetical protein